jgi:hypothetical protein
LEKVLIAIEPPLGLGSAATSKDVLRCDAVPMAQLRAVCDYISSPRCASMTQLKRLLCVTAM